MPPLIIKPATVVNREQWLTLVAVKAEVLFKGFRLAKYRISCSWPCRNALGRKERRIGECHALESSVGGIHEIFISPLIDDPLEVAGVVCHEMAHVAAGIDAGHAGKFVKVCRHVGLTKNKPTQAMPGPDLSDRLQAVIGQVGSYPHSKMIPTVKEAKPSTSVRLKCEQCGCTVVMTLKWLIEAGHPVCGCGGQMTAKEGGE